MKCVKSCNRLDDLSQFAPHKSPRQTIIAAFCRIPIRMGIGTPPAIRVSRSFDWIPVQRVQFLKESSFSMFKSKLLLMFAVAVVAMSARADLCAPSL